MWLGIWLWQQPELVSELESDLQYTDDWDRKWIVHFNTGSIDMKIDWSVLDEKSSFKMLGLSFFYIGLGHLHYLNW